MRRIEGAHELSCNALRWRKGNKTQEAVQAENKKDHARQIAGNCGSDSHNRVLLLNWQPFHGVNHIDVNMIDEVCLWRIQVFMTQGIPESDHVWLVRIKAVRAVTRYASAGIEDTGLGDSDFRVLEVLL